MRTSIINKVRVCFALLGVGCFASPLKAETVPVAAQSRQVLELFRGEMQQATTKLKWRGERLSEDTLYALALTGASWQEGWGRKHLFSMAWGDLKKVAALRKRDRRETDSLIESVKRDYEGRNYRFAIQTATDNFSMEEIACHPDLKEATGGGFLAARRYEEALKVYAAPYDPTKLEDVLAFNLKMRQGAFLAADGAARQGGAERDASRRSAIAFSLSLLLEPDRDNPHLNEEVLGYLERQGVELERIMLGILQAPQNLPGLPAYYYAAMDLLVYRAKAGLLPFFMHVAQSDDIYLRARSVLGLGILAYGEREREDRGWARDVLRNSLRPYGLSAGERTMILREIKEATQSGNYRLRTAGTLALALIGEEAGVPQLQKLAKDRAYTLSPQEKGRKDASRRILFPVRMAAAAGLARFGIQTPTGNGEFSGKELDRAKRGGQDVTRDKGGLERDAVSQIFITTLDESLAIPLETPRLK